MVGQSDDYRLRLLDSLLAQPIRDLEVSDACNKHEVRPKTSKARIRADI